MFYPHSYSLKTKENNNFNKGYIVEQQIFVACNLLHTKLQPETINAFILLTSLSFAEIFRNHKRLNSSLKQNEKGEWNKRKNKRNKIVNILGLLLSLMSSDS